MTSVAVKYEPEVAAAKLASGEVLYLAIADVARCFGMVADDFRPYLASGELTGYVLDRKPGAIKVGLRSDELLAWMVRHNRRMLPAGMR